MKNKDQDSFLISIRGATPIKKNNKLKNKIPTNTILNPIKKKMKHISAKKRVKNLTQTTNSSLFKLQKLPINKRLKRGKISIDKKIDFHGLTVLNAELLFVKTVKSCYEKNLRCILFVTGKGVLKKKDADYDTNIKLYYGKIRNSFIAWIKKDELQKYILGVEQASIEYGADGAFFVYLRKKKF